MPKRNLPLYRMVHTVRTNSSLHLIDGHSEIFPGVGVVIYAWVIALELLRYSVRVAEV